MNKLRAYIVTMNDGGEKLYLLDTEKIKNVSDAKKWLTETWGVPVKTITDQTRDRKEEINQSVHDLVAACAEE